MMSKDEIKEFISLTAGNIFSTHFGLPARMYSSLADKHPAMATLHKLEVLSADFDKMLTSRTFDEAAFAQLEATLLPSDEAASSFEMLSSGLIAALHR